MKPIGTLVYAINAGSNSTYQDKNGTIWLADQDYTNTVDWGALGGNSTIREVDLPINDRVAPELYKSERYGMNGYRFEVENGQYHVRIHCAETFEMNYKAGRRCFDVFLQGQSIAKDFDPFTAAKNFARAAIIEAPCCSVTDGLIALDFTAEKGMVNAIEIRRCIGESTERSIHIGPKQPTLQNKADTRAVQAPPVNILFLGNSGTFYWAIPETVADLLATGNISQNMKPTRTAYGKRFSTHYNNPATMDAIRSGLYQYVVIQGASNECALYQQEMESTAEKLIEDIRKHGAQPLLYAYQGCSTVSSADREHTAQTYINISQRHNVPVIPAVAALNKALQQQPDLNYYNPDQVHMGMHGAYLMAFSFYHFFTNEISHPYPSVLVGQVPISTDTARFLEKIVCEVFSQYKLQTHLL